MSADTVKLVAAMEDQIARLKRELAEAQERVRLAEWKALRASENAKEGRERWELAVRAARVIAIEEALETVRHAFDNGWSYESAREIAIGSLERLKSAPAKE